jgi:hypothetical protein
MITYYKDFPSFVEMFETVFGEDRILKSRKAPVVEMPVLLDGSPTRLIRDPKLLEIATIIHTEDYDALYPRKEKETATSEYPVQQIKFLVVHSPQDTWVNPKQSEELCAALKERYPGVHVEYDHKPYGDHWDVVQTLQKPEIIAMYVKFIETTL